MNKQKFLLGLIVFILGFIGVASTITMKVTIPEEVAAMLQSKFSDQQIKLLLLVNPTILLLIAVVVGTLLFDKAGLSLPFVERLVRMRSEKPNFYSILKFGVIGGLISGVLLSLISYVLNPIIPNEFLELSENVKPSLASRFLYGGFTEEILMRFGLMSLIVWLLSKIIKGNRSFVNWLGILFAAIIFAVGHFPITFQALTDPSNLLLTYILIGNSVGGIIFGWLYWKKGLEASFIAHIFTHIVLVIFSF
jgi:hypothetical protein